MREYVQHTFDLIVFKMLHGQFLPSTNSIHLFNISISLLVYAYWPQEIYITYINIAPNFFLGGRIIKIGSPADRELVVKRKKWCGPLVVPADWDYFAWPTPL